MNEVIDLLDSEDEDEGLGFQQAKETPMMSSPQRPTPRKLTSNPVSQLSSAYDGSDSDESLEVVENPQLKKTATMQPSETNYNSDDSLEVVGNRHAKEASQFLSRKQSPRKTPVNPYARTPRVSLSTGKGKHAIASMPINPYARVPPLSRDDWDSDSDDSLLMAAPVFLRPMPTFPATPSTATTASETSAAVAMPSSSDKHSVRPALYTSPQSDKVDAPFLYPKLLSTSKTYEDLRPKYVLAFWNYARKRVQHSHDRAKLDQISKKVVLLALTPHPIRSLEEYCFSRGVGGGSGATAHDRKIRDEIKSQLIEGGLDTIRMPSNDGKFTSIAEACLVTMLSYVERKLIQKDIDPRVLTILDDASLQIMLGEKDMWISLKDLIPAIDSLLKPSCPARLTRPNDDDNGASHYTTPTTRSAEFLQIAKLELSLPQLGDTDEKVGRIKRHRQGGQTLYELTSLGCKSARMIRSRDFPAAPGHYRCSRIHRMSQVEETYRGICLGVDLREGGGGQSVLHEMCNNLDRKKVPYFVGTMHIGDYVFFTQKAGSSDYLLCPILVERKSIEDIVLSIHDGRWRNQKQRMYVGQYVFGYENSRMVFIIEGKEEKQQVTGGYIGHRMYDVNIDRVKDEIENLKSEGFEVLRTPSRENTMFELGRWSKRIAEEMRTGVLTAQYTYSQFREEVKKIPPGTDFSRLAKYAVARKVEAAAAAASAWKRAHAEIDSNNDIEVLEMLTPSTDSKKAAAHSSSNASTPSSVKPASSDQKVASKKAKTDSDQYEGFTAEQLRRKCVEYGLSKSGKISDMKARLNGPHPPNVYVRRRQAGQYVPKSFNVAATALLVALYLHEKDAAEGDPGMTKEELYVKAEELDITKNPFSGGTTQTGPYLYDGWSSMKPLLTGDPALVILSRKRYKLTRSSELAGHSFAEAMHKWCHQHNNCPCGTADF